MIKLQVLDVLDARVFRVYGQGNMKHPPASVLDMCLTLARISVFHVSLWGVLNSGGGDCSRSQKCNDNT